MSKMLGKNNVPIAKANIAATDFHRQNRLRTRKFSEHFSKQTGKFSLGKGLHEIVECPHLKSLQCMVGRCCGEDQKAVCIRLPKFLCGIHAA